MPPTTHTLQTSIIIRPLERWREIKNTPGGGGAHVEASLLHGENELGEVYFQDLGRHARDQGDLTGLVGWVNRLQDLHQLIRCAPEVRIPRRKIKENSRDIRGTFAQHSREIHLTFKENSRMVQEKLNVYSRIFSKKWN